MKLKHWFITLFIFFTCHTVVSANTTLDKLTQDDGITALKAGDELGFEVLSRAELESVRGEALFTPFILFAASIGYDSIFNDGKNTIRVVALIYQKFGHPGFVQQLESKGIL
jgi:hypothetical protein